MEAGCEHRVHHPPAAAKCAQCARVCNPDSVDVVEHCSFDTLTATMGHALAHANGEQNRYYLQIDFGTEQFVKGLFTGGGAISESQSTRPGKDTLPNPGPKTKNTCHQQK
jgi:hypothetical protein